MANGSTVRTLPYASAQHVVRLIQRYRSKGLPQPLSKGDVEAMNIPSSSAFRALQALKFLRLVDDAGFETDRFDQLKRASDSEYRTLFADILKDAYSGVFQYIDPADVDPAAIESAFRKYDPVSERNRMINLFLGLCVEAGLVSEENRPKTKAPRTPRVVGQPRRLAERKAVERVNNDVAREDFTPAPPRENSPRRESSTDDIPEHYRLIVELLRRLPVNQKWTPQQRKKWLGAMEANVDVVVEVSDNPETMDTEPRGESQNEGSTSWR